MPWQKTKGVTQQTTAAYVACVLEKPDEVLSRSHDLNSTTGKSKQYITSVHQTMC